MLLGVDVGGTFTDAVVAVDGRLVTAKAPTTPHDQSEGVLAAVRAALERAGAGAGDVEAFAHGTTVATNALLEGRGARTVLVATEGFEDVVELGRQARADLYRLCAAHPAPLVPPELRVGAPERMTPDGAAARARGSGGARRAVAALEPEAVAVCLLHAYRHSAHEQAIGAALRRAAARRRTSRSPTRSSARSASTSGRRRPSSTPRCRRCSAPTSRRSPAGRRTPGCRRPTSCSPRAASPRSRRPARTRRSRSSRGRPAARRAPRGRHSRRASAARCASTWAARRATCA